MIQLLNLLEFVAEIIGLLLALIFFGVFVAASIDIHMYKKKHGPVKTDVVCPNTKRKLMDFELMYGHCVSCRFHEICKEKMKKATNGDKTNKA